MILTVEKHSDYRIFDRDGNEVDLVFWYDTETREARMYKDLRSTDLIDEDGNIKTVTVILEGSYAMDPAGNKY